MSVNPFICRAQLRLMGNFCECGCGTVLTPLVGRHGQNERRFIHGHNQTVASTRKPRVVVVCPNPSGLCMCGCGKPVTRAVRDHGANQVAGQFLRYLPGHWPIWETRRHPINPADNRGPNPAGLCMCGCGSKVGICDRTDPARQLLAGCYTRFLKGHDKRHPRNNAPNPNPSGMCLCGCGLATPAATFTRNGNVKGFPRLYFDPGHAQRIEYRENPKTKCWELPARKGDGYSRIHRNGRLYLGHVWFWECLRGKLGPNQELDHLCRNRACVNPDHLEPVSHEENMRRIRFEIYIPQWSEHIQPTKQADDGCWIFPVTQSDGYARLWVRNSLLMAHRVFYENEKGRIQDGLELDHTCKRKACVNPAHLEPVTHKENMRREIVRASSPSNRI